MDQPASAIEQARMAWRRAVEERTTSLSSAREQAETELRRRWALLRDAVEGALASGMSLEEIGRWLGVAQDTLATLIGTSGPTPA